MAYLEGEESQLNVEDIRGVWVASDDDRMVEIVREIAPSYLPNVENSTIYWASGGVEGGPDLRRMATRTDRAVNRKGMRVEVESTRIALDENSWVLLGSYIG